MTSGCPSHRAGRPRKRLCLHARAFEMAPRKFAFAQNCIVESEPRRIGIAQLDVGDINANCGDWHQPDSFGPLAPRYPQSANASAQIGAQMIVRKHQGRFESRNRDRRAPNLSALGFAEMHSRHR